MKQPDDAGRPPERDAAPPAPSHGRDEARSRFWAEFRAGQREAQARIARRAP